ncbi:MAG: tetratricopeptide repeat protein [Candidatus Hydrogenedens sp.]
MIFTKHLYKLSMIYFLMVCSFAWTQSSESLSGENTQLDFANGLYSRQFFKEATDEYKKFIAQYPDSPKIAEVYLRLGKSALVEKQYETAMGAFDQVINKATDANQRTEAILRKGECFYYLKRWAECSETLKPLIEETTPKDYRPRAMYFYARALVQTQNFETAIPVLQNMVKTFPEYPLVPFAKYVLGNIYTRLNQLENAVSILSDVASNEKIDPQLRMECNFRVAEIYSQLGWYEGAMNAYQTLKTQFKEGPYKEKSDFGYLWTLYQAKKFPEAVNEGKNFIQNYPQSEKKPFAMYILANSLLEQNMLDEALSFYNSLRQQYADTSYATESLYKIAWAHYLKNDLNIAKTNVTEFLDKAGESPFRADAYFLLGSLYTAEGNYEDAMEEFQMVYEKYPTSKFAPEALYKSAECAELLGIIKPAMQLYNRFIQTYPQHTLIVSAYLHYGDLQGKDGNWEEALKTYLKAKEISENNPLQEQVFLRLAHCYEQLHKGEDAFQIYQDFISRFPQSQYVQDMKLKLGTYYLKEKKDSIKSIDSLQNLLAQNPAPTIAGQAWLAISIAYYEVKDYEKSAEALLKTIVDYPQVTVGEEQFAWLAQYYLDAQKWEQARQVLKRMQEVLKDYPAPQRLQFRYAECIHNLGKLDEAIKEYQKVVDMSPSSTSATESLYRIAQIYEQKNQVSQALEFYERCANNGGSETSARAQFRISEIYENQNEFEKAGKNYLKVAILYLHPELSPEALWRSGKCYLKINEKGNAQRAFKELLDDFPSHPLAEKVKGILSSEKENTPALSIELR